MENKNKMSGKQFWIRFVIWIAVAILAPIGFMFYKYDMIVKTHTEASDGYSMTGWGVLGCIIVTVFLLYVIHEAKKGLSYGSMLSQCIDGYALLIPGVVLIFLLDAIKDNIAAFEQVLIAFVICEAIAVPINPMRRWAFEHNIEMKGHFFTDIISKAIKKSKTEEEEKK